MKITIFIIWHVWQFWSAEAIMKLTYTVVHLDHSLQLEDLQPTIQLDIWCYFRWYRYMIFDANSFDDMIQI